MNCSPPGSFVHGILQARILEWVAIRFSRGSFRPSDGTLVSHIAGRFFTVWATRESWWNMKYSHIAKKLWSFLYMMWPLLKSHLSFLSLGCLAGLVASFWIFFFSTQSKNSPRTTSVCPISLYLHPPAEGCVLNSIMCDEPSKLY